MYIPLLAFTLSIATDLAMPDLCSNLQHGTYKKNCSQCFCNGVYHYVYSSAMYSGPSLYLFDSVDNVK